MKISLKKSMVLSNFFIVFAIIFLLLLANFDQKIFFIVSIVTIHSTLIIASTVIFIYFNNIIKDKLRSTTSSFITLIDSLVQIMIIPIIGYAINKYELIPFVILYCSALIVIIVLRKKLFMNKP